MIHYITCSCPSCQTKSDPVDTAYLSITDVNDSENGRMLLIAREEDNVTSVFLGVAELQTLRSLIDTMLED